MNFGEIMHEEAQDICQFTLADLKQMHFAKAKMSLFIRLYWRYVTTALRDLLSVPDGDTISTCDN